ncbi:MAG: hypothetical protein KGR26_07430 [Cyanobacteria bacterium REEB65]|nr:hypothetical protein [Cyanobacteria bacterium REEB65]
MVERVATLHELETHWSLRDLILANEALDLRAEAQKAADEAARRKADGGA